MIVIVIDALDELKDAAKSVMEILSYIAPIDCDLPNNVRFVITSRPEHWADISMSKNLELTAFKQQSLTTESSVFEVHNFIVAQMREIKPDEPDWQDWPHPYQLQRLSDKANGLFHYAATTLQWIEGQIWKYKKACKSRVFDQFDQMGIGQLDDLYKLILTSWENVDDPAVNAQIQLDGFHHVIGTILALEKPLTISQIIVLLLLRFCYFPMLRSLSLSLSSVISCLYLCSMVRLLSWTFIFLCLLCLQTSMTFFIILYDSIV